MSEVQKHQKQRAERARQGSRRRRDLEALEAEGGDPPAKYSSAYIEAMRQSSAKWRAQMAEARELFPDIGEEWIPVVSVAIWRLRRSDREITLEAIAHHLLDQGYEDAVTDLLDGREEEPAK